MRGRGVWINKFISRLSFDLLSPFHLLPPYTRKLRFTTKQMASMRMDQTQLRRRLKSSLIRNFHRDRPSYLTRKTLQGRGTRDIRPTRAFVVSCIWGGLTAGRSPLAVSSRQHVSTKDTWPATRPTRSRELVYFWP
jgi:hypothetical protein